MELPKRTIGMPSYVERLLDRIEEIVGEITRDSQELSVLANQQQQNPHNNYVPELLALVVHLLQLRSEFDALTAQLRADGRLK